MKTKEEVARNFYRTAVLTSSDSQNKDHSVSIVTDLLSRNGYHNPQKFNQASTSRPSSIRRKARRQKDDKVILSLPFISDSHSSSIMNYIRREKLPIRTVFTPGRKLRDIFTRSRPHDSVRCPVGNSCKICPNMHKAGCAQMGSIYVVTCRLCHEEYVGETYRPLHDRMMEHQRAAANPPSYPDNAIGKHYLFQHTGEAPDLSYDIMDIQHSTVKRKISEAATIFTRKPKINDRTELQSLKKFLV